MGRGKYFYKTITFNTSGTLIAKIVSGFITISSSYKVLCNELYVYDETGNAGDITNNTAASNGGGLV